MIPVISSYWKVFRLIFILFSLYLLRDAFFRWGGFRYHSTFLEFLPSVTLITILWTIMAVFAAMIVWLMLRAFERFCLSMRWKIRIEHLLLFMGTFILLASIFWAGKKLIWSPPLPLILKQIVFLCVVLAAVVLTFRFRNKPGIIQERITPLVWLFGIWVVLSVPLVAYHTWGKQADNVISQKILQPSITDVNRPNVILVTFDALAAKDMSVYGYHRPTTPFISEWAKTASLFTRLEAEGNYTTPTTTSIMTGKRLWTHNVYYLREGSSIDKSLTESLPLLLSEKGYYNMAFIQNYYASVRALGIQNEFEIAPIASEFWTSTSLRSFIQKILYHLFGEKIRLYNWILLKDFFPGNLLNIIINKISPISKTPFPIENVFNSFLTVLDKNTPELFFAWIHLMPPHKPYLPPKPYLGMFDPSLNPKTFAQLIKDTEKNLDILRVRYDEFIRYCDKQFEYFIAQLKKRNVLKNTVIILSSDHGENFEHNFGHIGPNLYEPVTHIPLIIKEPYQSEGRIVNDLVEQIDIPPTILDLANIPVPSWMEGRSLIPFMRGKKLLSRPTFSLNLVRNPKHSNKITKGTIAVWEGDYKLIHYLEDEKSLLFNLKEDPSELNNLFDKEPEVGNHLLALIKDNLKKANERISRENK